MSVIHKRKKKKKQGLKELINLQMSPIYIGDGQQMGPGLG